MWSQSAYTASTRMAAKSTSAQLLLWIIMAYCIGMMRTADTADTADNASTASTANTANTVPEKVVQDIDDFIRAMKSCKTLREGLSVSIVKDGRVILSKGYGFTSVNRTSPVTSKTRFAIGSLSKAFTALLLAKVVKESDEVDFDKPIKEFLPDFRLVDDYRSDHTTLRDLLGHRMAIPQYDLALMLGIDPKTSRKELARRIQHFKTPYSFREKSIYNNYMYILAGTILEQLSGGRSWESLVRENIFKPLGMSDSGFVDQITDFDKDFALPFAFKRTTFVDIDPVAFKLGHVAGPAGTISSTADDMAKWMMFLLADDNSATNHSQIDSSMVKMTFEPSIMFRHGAEDLYKPVYPVNHQQKYYSMGWITSIYREYRKIFHTGGILTHSSRLWLYPDTKLGIFVSVNGPAWARSKLLSAIPFYVSDLLLGLPPWFSESDVCGSGPLPWAEKNEEEEDQTEVAPTTENPDEALFNCTAGITKCDFSDYVGTYSHEVYGDAYVSLMNDSSNSSSGIGQPNKLNFIYGRFGWLELTPKSRSNFVGRMSGPLWFLDYSDLDLFTVRFSTGEESLGEGESEDKNINRRVVSLQMGYADDYIGPFIKQGMTGAGSNMAARNTPTLLSRNLACVLVFAIMSFVL